MDEQHPLKGFCSPSAREQLQGTEDIPKLHFPHTTSLSTKAELMIFDKPKHKVTTELNNLAASCPFKITNPKFFYLEFCTFLIETAGNKW